MASFSLPPLPSAAVYAELGQALRGVLPARRVVTDPLRLLAYGTDASLYRLVPRLVVIAEAEAEVRTVLELCRRHRAPVTFRAAGTSLAGQALSESVLLLLGDHWNGIAIERGGEAIRLQPGVVGAQANLRLLPYARKIGPDPASINAARIGGIAANNASGMCCGTHENSYQTLESMRIVLADGTLLDTGSAGSRAAFAASHGELLARLAARRLTPTLLKTTFTISSLSCTRLSITIPSPQTGWLMRMPARYCCSTIFAGRAGEGSTQLVLFAP